MFPASIRSVCIDTTQNLAIISIEWVQQRLEFVRRLDSVISISRHNASCVCDAFLRILSSTLFAQPSHASAPIAVGYHHVRNAVATTPISLIIDRTIFVSTTILRFRYPQMVRSITRRLARHQYLHRRRNTARIVFVTLYHYAPIRQSNALLCNVESGPGGLYPEMRHLLVARQSR